MQSGISASKELQDAFQSLVSSPSQRGLLATISKEQLIPGPAITSTTSDFSSDLSALAPLLQDKEAAYVILRRYPEANDGFVAITYVPDSAPVRQKMLFASTRLTLVRELGIERFRETIFATTKSELTAEGFKKHDQHTKLAAPLTEEEQELGKVKRLEAEEGRGTGIKKSHLSDHFTMQLTDDAHKALQSLGSGGVHDEDNLVQLKINTSLEVVELAQVSSAAAGTLSSTISQTEPRFSFFRYTYSSADGSILNPIVFIYTFPESSNRKERMMYASMRLGMVGLAEKETGLKIEKRLEESDPQDVTESLIEEEFKPKVEVKKTFDRPKRPGRK